MRWMASVFDHIFNIAYVFGELGRYQSASQWKHCNSLTEKLLSSNVNILIWWIINWPKINHITLNTWWKRQVWPVLSVFLSTEVNEPYTNYVNELKRWGMIIREMGSAQLEIGCSGSICWWASTCPIPAHAIVGSGCTWTDQAMHKWPQTSFGAGTF